MSDLLYGHDGWLEPPIDHDEPEDELDGLEEDNSDDGAGDY